MDAFWVYELSATPGPAVLAGNQAKPSFLIFFSTPWYSHIKALPDARGDMMCRDRARRQQEMLLLQEQ